MIPIEEEEIQESESEGETGFEVSTINNGIRTNVQKFNQYFSDFEEIKMKFQGSVLSFDIPTSELKGFVRKILSFDVSPILIQVSIAFNDSDGIRDLSIRNPTYDKKFPGFTLVSDCITSFFKNRKVLSRSELFWPRAISKKIQYDDCPYAYLIGQILRKFESLTTNCCNCGKDLGRRTIKPSPCESLSCITFLRDLGLSDSVWNQIHRDPFTSDLLVSLFSEAIGSRFIKDKARLIGYEDQDTNSSKSSVLLNFVSTLPSMQDLVTWCKNDQEIETMIGSENYKILHGILLGNEADLFLLPDQLKISGIPHPYHFMQVSTIPEREINFRKLEGKYGTYLLWHGSQGERWYSIFKNSLKNYSNTAESRNGCSCGEGIYLAYNSNTSYQSIYSSPIGNRYNNSKIGHNFYVIGLVEATRSPGLKDHGWCCTMTDEDGVVVRFLLVSPQPYSLDVHSNPPHLPTIDEVFAFYDKK